MHRVYHDAPAVVHPEDILQPVSPGNFCARALPDFLTGRSRWVTASLFDDYTPGALLLIRGRAAPSLCNVW